MASSRSPTSWRRTISPAFPRSRSSPTATPARSISARPSSRMLISPTHSSALAEIGASLAPGGAIQLFGCDVAQGTAGQQFIDDFSTYTGGAQVDASTQSVGSAALGGSWILNAAAAGGAPLPGGAPPTVTAPFTPAALANFQGTLGPAGAPDPELWIAALNGGTSGEIVRVDDVGGTATSSLDALSGRQCDRQHRSGRHRSDQSGLFRPARNGRRRLPDPRGLAGPGGQHPRRDPDLHDGVHRYERRQQDHGNRARHPQPPNLLHGQFQWRSCHRHRHR